MSENKLERLPDTVGELDHLTDLYLSDNQIDCLPDTFGPSTLVADFLSLTLSQTVLH